jgi:hypothetical protein
MYSTSQESHRENIWLSVGRVKESSVWESSKKISMEDYQKGEYRDGCSCKFGESFGPIQIFHYI